MLSGRVQVEFARHIYKLDVTEVKPAVQRGNAPPAVSIIETDIKVDFKEPRDYKEWEKRNKEKKFSNKPSSESKEEVDEEDDDGFGMIVDPTLNALRTKQSHFDSLEHRGCRGQKLKRQKRAKTQSPLKSGGQSTGGKGGSSYSSQSVNSSPAGKINPYSTRGQPLGAAKGGALGGGGKRLVKGSTSMGQLLKNKAVRKEEEIVGSMRYIYEVDELGKRTLVRRLPVRKISSTADTASHSLK